MLLFFIKNNDDFIGEYLKLMYAKGFLEIKIDKYIPTEKGRQYLEGYFAKYYEYLKMFDIYCAVDLDKGEFAFSSMNNSEMVDDEAWGDFLGDKRFSDVRVAVAEFKGVDPIEIVFMSFLNEGRLDTKKYGWQYELAKGKVWDDIEVICNTAVSSDYLKTNGVLEDIITQGSKIAIQLIKDAEDSINSENEEQEEVVETTVVEEYVDIVEMHHQDCS